MLRGRSLRRRRPGNPGEVSKSWQRGFIRCVVTTRCGCLASCRQSQIAISDSVPESDRRAIDHLTASTRSFTLLGMPPKSRIIVVGSINTDLVIRGPRLPGPGETVMGGEFYQAAGGKGANQAVAAARAALEP